MGQPNEHHHFFNCVLLPPSCEFS